MPRRSQGAPVRWPNGSDDGDTRAAVLSVIDERARQERLRSEGRFPFTCASHVPNAFRLAVLAEEFGEVARLVTEQLIHGERFDHSKMRDELVQVAAVAVAWIEGLEAAKRLSERAEKEAGGT